MEITETKIIFIRFFFWNAVFLRQGLRNDFFFSFGNHYFVTLERCLFTRHNLQGTQKKSLTCIQLSLLDAVIVNIQVFFWGGTRNVNVVSERSAGIGQSPRSKLAVPWHWNLLANNVHARSKFVRVCVYRIHDTKAIKKIDTPHLFVRKSAAVFDFITQTIFFVYLSPHYFVLDSWFFRPFCYAGVFSIAAERNEAFFLAELMTGRFSWFFQVNRFHFSYPTDPYIIQIDSNFRANAQSSWITEKSERK